MLSALAGNCLGVKQLGGIQTSPLVISLSMGVVSIQFHFIVSEDTLTVSIIFREDEKPLHLFTVHADKFDFKGFEKEVEFYLYSVRNSSIRTVWVEDQRTVDFTKNERGRLLFATDQEEDPIEKIILDVHEKQKASKKELERKQFFGKL